MKVETKKRNLSKNCYILGTVGVIALNLLAWLSADFCDWYRDNVFPIWLNTYARLTSTVPISIGEIMLILAVGITAFGIGFFLFHIIQKRRYRKAVRCFGRFYAWTVLVVCYVMTLNCFILFHAPSFSEKYMSKGRESDMMVANLGGNAAVDLTSTHESAHTKKNLTVLRDYLVEKCNDLAAAAVRDENGRIICDEAQLISKSVQAMRDLGEEYSQLSGFYVNPKYLTCSEFFSQQYIMGYYFPFSMEANLNSVMYVANLAPTVCHELAHTKGFIFEDDANMIGFLACIQSEDPFLQYCGYLSVLNYVNNDFYEAIGKNQTTYRKHVRISDTVAEDNIFLTKEDWQEVEKKAVVKTETVKKVSNNLMNTTLKLNGVEEGMQQYNQVVNLLLDYYDGTLF